MSIYFSSHSLSSKNTSSSDAPTSASSSQDNRALNTKSTVKSLSSRLLSFTGKKIVVPFNLAFLNKNIKKNPILNKNNSPPQVNHFNPPQALHGGKINNSGSNEFKTLTGEKFSDLFTSKILNGRSNNENEYGSKIAGAANHFIKHQMNLHQISGYPSQADRDDLLHDFKLTSDLLNTLSDLKVTQEVFGKNSAAFGMIGFFTTSAYQFINGLLHETTGIKQSSMPEETMQQVGWSAVMMSLDWALQNAPETARNNPERPLYKGLSLDSDTVEKMIADFKNEKEVDVTSSFWSTTPDLKSASGFAIGNTNNSNGQAPVIFEFKGSNAPTVEPFTVNDDSPDLDEHLLPPLEKYKMTDTKTITSEEGQKIRVMTFEKSVK